MLFVYLSLCNIIHGIVQCFLPPFSVGKLMHLMLFCFFDCSFELQTDVLIRSIHSFNSILFWKFKLESYPTLWQLVSNVHFVSTGRNPCCSWDVASCDWNHAITFDCRCTYGIEFYWCDVKLITSQMEV